MSNDNVPNFTVSKKERLVLIFQSLAEINRKIAEELNLVAELMDCDEDKLPKKAIDALEIKAAHLWLGVA